jgi:hypothetical protein
MDVTDFQIKHSYLSDNIAKLSGGVVYSINVQNYTVENLNNVRNFVLYFLDQNPQIKIDLQSIENENKMVNVQGQVFRIPKNDKAFEEFFKHTRSNKFQYSHFSVAADGDSWAIFFL